MTIALWILQVLLALHTVAGAVWKYFNGPGIVPSLSAIPQGVWLALAVVELVCAAGLVLPAISRSLARLAPLAAIVTAVEMLLFIAVALSSAQPNAGQMIYWLVVAAICAFTAYGRLVLRPL